MAAVGTRPNPAVLGALKMGLHTGGMDYEFLPAAGSTYEDSGSLTCRTKTPPRNVPVAPTDVNVTRVGDGKVTVSWAEPQPQASGVTYTARAVGGLSKCVTTANSCTIAGLKNGQPYRFDVTAGKSATDATAAPSEPFAPAVRPSAPSAPSVKLTGTTAELAWTTSGYDGGLPIMGYEACSTAGGKPA